MSVHEASAEARERRRTRRTAEDLRAALIEAARDRFARQGYEQVSVREIAGQAGLQASLINRYFGSKEALFRAVLATAPGFGDGDGAARPAAEGLARSASRPPQEGTDPGNVILSLALGSAGSPVAAEIIAHDVVQRFVRPLGRRLAGEDAELRAAILGAFAMGLGLSRDHMRIKPLADCSPEALYDIIAPLFAQLADGAGSKVG